MKKYILLGVLICMVMIGCATSIAPTVQPPASSGIVQEMLTLTPEITLATPATNSPTVVPAQQCFSISEMDVELSNISSGTILWDKNLKYPESLLVNIETGQKYELSARGANGQVSPDGDKFAYVEDVMDIQGEPTGNLLWVVNARSEALAQVSFEQKEFIELPRWLDNNRLILRTKKQDTFIVINPFTDERSVVSNELPLLYTGPAPGLNWRAEYSPDLSQVIYYYVGEKKDDIIPVGSILRDIATKQNLWQSIGGDESQPVWSPDGKEVAATGGGQLYLVNQLGQAMPVLSASSPKLAQSPSWSPNGQYIAFWNDRNLWVYDTKKDQVMDLCIPYGSGAVLPKPPLWTPDSKQITVLTYTPEQNLGFQVLIDLHKRGAYKIAELPELSSSHFLAAWMNSIP